LTGGKALLRLQGVDTSPNIDLTFPFDIGEQRRAQTKARRATRRTVRVDLGLDHAVQQLLEEHRGQWRAIELATGVSHSWLSKFTNGKIVNPGYATLKHIHALLSQPERRSSRSAEAEAA